MRSRQTAAMLAGALLAGALLACAAGGSARAWGDGRAAGAGDRALYPPPVRTIPGGALSSCPNPARLGPFGGTGERLARTEALRYGRISLSVDLADSDRSWRPAVRASWAGSHGRPPVQAGEVVRQVIAARRSAFRIIVSRSCGQALIDRSLAVTIGPRTPPGQRKCEACARTFFLIDRAARPLIYYVY